MSRLGSMGGRLYRGEVSYDFVGRQRLWYILSAFVLLLAIAGLLIRGLHLSVDFKGGAVFTVKKPGVSVVQARDVVTQVPGVTDPIVQTMGSDKVKIQIGDIGTGTERADAVKSALSQKLGVQPSDIDVQVVGPSWGQEISKKALTGLIIFLLLVVFYLSLAFEWKMALAALVALAHDLVATVGIYALVGFEVSPATVIGLLTILGYSLYDTVVVFDKVKENTAGITGGSRVTYSEAANLAVNQTLVRSINTSIIALLPVASLLFVGAGLLGAGVLKDLALALFVGMAVGTYSSICIATPILADLKEREPAMQALARRVAVRRSGERAGGKQPEAVGAGATTGRLAQRGPLTSGGGNAGDKQSAPLNVSSGPSTPRRPSAGQNRNKAKRHPDGRKRK